MQMNTLNSRLWSLAPQRSYILSAGIHWSLQQLSCLSPAQWKALYLIYSDIIMNQKFNNLRCCGMLLNTLKTFSSGMFTQSLLFCQKLYLVNTAEYCKESVTVHWRTNITLLSFWAFCCFHWQQAGTYSRLLQMLVLQELVTGLEFPSPTQFICQEVGKKLRG